MNFDRASRSKLTRRDRPRFGDDTLFHRIARAVCDAECLPRKELFEAWELARRTRRRFRGGRVLDLACGHALVAHVMLLLDDTSPNALAVDTCIPSSAPKIAARLVGEWPRLAGRVQLVEGAIQSVEACASDLIVSCHACGRLTDDVLEMAVAASARVVVLPCCHDATQGDLGGLSGWVDLALAIDVTRAARLRQRGYAVYTQTLSASITPKNRLLLAEPLREPDPAAPRWLERP